MSFYSVPVLYCYIHILYHTYHVFCQEKPMSVYLKIITCEKVKMQLSLAQLNLTFFCKWKQFNTGSLKRE